MNNVDKQYLDLLQDIINNGTHKNTRAGEVLSVFGRQMRFNLKDGLPILTTKKVFTKGVIHELLWFLSGNTNIKYLVDNNVHIWDDDAYRHYTELIKKHNEQEHKNSSMKPNIIEPVSKEEFIEKVKNNETIVILYNLYHYGDLGPVYGQQWRSFGTTNSDQIQNIINTLKTNPDDRRMLCAAYNPDVLDKVALPPCHIMFQFYTKELENGKRELSCSFYMRSNDFCCGNPFNIMQYALLTYMIAEVCDMEVGELVYFGGDIHVYTNHIEQAKEQLERKGSDIIPTLKFARKIENIFDFRYEDFIIENYNPDPPIKFSLNVG